MRTRWLLVLVFAAFAFSRASAQRPNNYSIEIDLQDQMAYLLEDNQLLLSTPISTGRAGHLTETGVFKIIEKERSHFSNMYGQIVDARGNVVVTDGDADMAVPPGGKFVPAPMRYFMRFNGAIGMHAGYLPGYAASHGCVRLPENNAIALFNAVDVGTPVTVFGRTPTRRQTSNEQAFSMQRRRRAEAEPRFDNRYLAAPSRW